MRTAMTQMLTPKLPTYAGLAGLGMLSGLLFGRPEPALLGFGFLIVVALGLALSRAPTVEVELALDRERVIEGQDVVLLVRVMSESSPHALDLEVPVPRGLDPRDSSRLTGLRPRPDGPLTVELPITCRRWGGYTLGGVRVRARDPLGLFRFEDRIGTPLGLRVYPPSERVRSLVRPLETQVIAGNFVARSRGEGIEFADIRAFQPGDRVRRVNWRVSARESRLYVNEQHPERNADVVLFIDTFAGLSRREGGSLDLAVRAAAALASRYLAGRDRVGVVAFGGILRWVRPGMGLRQQYRLLESLVESEIVASYAWKGIEVIPPGVLPAKALVVALTPLIDERAVNALYDARGRGFDLAVVELDPSPLLQPATTEIAVLARRLWRLRRDSVRERLREAGVPVTTWSGAEALEAAVEEVRGLRWRSAAVRV
jgi:uncharacterized protein (DUF58 family)